MNEIKEFVEYLVKLIVDKPEEIEIAEKRGEQVIIFEVRANKQDFGKILGKHGKNIQAIRTLVNSVSAKAGKRSIIEIIE
ncbi:MAG: KH domain-containing protein [Calditrichia bacterium]|nr:KH domain-containing protein [Calditrichia bacterium]